MTIGVTTFASDSVKQVRDMLSTGITDPIASRRPPESRFVMTSYPQKLAMYPMITVRLINAADIQQTGMGSEGKITRVKIEVRVWAKDVQTRDSLFDQTYTYLRQNQLGASSTNEAGLFDFTLTSSVPIDEDGDAGVHSMVSEYSYFAVLTP